MRPVLLLTLLSVSGFAADRPDPFHWHGPVAPGLAVEIRGLNGDVHAEFSSGTEVEVYAQMSGSNPVRVDVIHHTGGVTVCTISRSDPKQRSHQLPAAGDARVNYTVRVPKGGGLIGRTVNGEVEAQNLQGGVNAETVNGKIRISTRGRAQARTVNGNIMATCSMKSAALSNVNGSITLETPSLTNAAFLAETRNGAITTDFRIAGQRSLSPHRIASRNGNGSREIKLKTVNGSIQLRRLG